jgi:hypothetical protein
MGGNKERLYVALYETDRESTMPGGEDKYESPSARSLTCQDLTTHATLGITGRS